MPGALDIESLLWLATRASDADAANDSAQCNLAVETLLKEVQSHGEELRAGPGCREIARRLVEVSRFLSDEGHAKTAAQAIAVAEELVPGGP